LTPALPYSILSDLNPNSNPWILHPTDPRDYVTNFNQYLAPFPNYYVLGPNIQFFASRGVAGIFEEGSYNSPGGDMEILKDYIIGRMLTDPTLNATTLIQAFLDGYYSKASPFVTEYMIAFKGAISSTGYYMGESFDENAPFYTPEVLLSSKQVLDQGAAAVADEDARFGPRVAHVVMAVQYVALLRWDELEAFAESSSVAWPFSQTKEEEFALFNATATALEVTHVREWGSCGVECFHDLVFPSV